MVEVSQIASLPDILTASILPLPGPLFIWMLQIHSFKGGKRLTERERQEWAEVGPVGQSRLVKKEALKVMGKGGGAEIM